MAELCMVALPLIATVLASLLIVILHKIFAILAFKSKRFGKIVKGEYRILQNNNKLVIEELEKQNITKDDLLEVCRRQCHHNNLESISKIILERSGQISLIKSEEKKMRLE